MIDAPSSTTPDEYLVEGTIPAQSVFALISACPQADALGLAACVASVRVTEGPASAVASFAGRGTQHGRAISFIAVDDIPAADECIMSWIEEHGLAPHLHLIAGEPSLNDEADVLAVSRQAITETGGDGAPLVRVILFDGSSAAVIEDGNSAAAVKKAATTMRALARATGAAVGLVLHDRATDPRNPRGSAAIFAEFDCVAVVAKHDSERTLTVIAKAATSNVVGDASKVYRSTQKASCVERLRGEGTAVVYPDIPLVAATDPICRLDKFALYKRYHRLFTELDGFIESRLPSPRGLTFRADARRALASPNGAEFAAAVRAVSALSDALKPAYVSLTLASSARDTDEAYRAPCRTAFAAANGWKYTSKPPRPESLFGTAFDPKKLLELPGDVWDHPELYLRSGVLAAVIVFLHSEIDLDKVPADITVDRLPESWYSPGETIAYVLCPAELKTA